MYKYSAVSRERNGRLTPTSDDDSYFSEDNDGGWNIRANNKGEVSQPIVKNIKKKKYKKKKQGMHLSLIFVGMEKVNKAPLLWLKMTLFMDEIYGKKITEKYKVQLYFYMVAKYDCELK